MRLPAVLFATLATAFAAPAGPGDAALAYLEKVRERNVDLAPGGDTAIAPETSREKRREIARRLDRVAADIGGEELELGPVKLDGDLAAVLVRRSPGFDPTSLHIVPVGLVRRAGRWLPAPLPSSFENAGLQYLPEFRKRLESLEAWMLRHRSLDLLTLRQDASARIRRRIEAGLPLAKLKAMNPRQAADCFLDACRERDVAVAVGLLGGLSDFPPADLRTRIRVCEESLRDPAPGIRPWFLLTSTDTLRAVVHEEEDRRSALVSVAFLDPAVKTKKSGGARVEVVHIELIRGRDELWRVDPGETFWNPAAADEDSEDAAALDGDLVDLFPAALAKAHPARPKADAEEAEAATLAAVRAAHPSALLETARIPENPGIARIALGRIARFWNTAHGGPPRGHVVPLTRMETDDFSVLYLQLLSSRDPEAFQPSTLVFRRAEDGWLWVPDSLSTGDAAARWIEEQEARWAGEWSAKLLEPCTDLDAMPDLAPPTVEEARSVVERWIDQLRNGDLPAGLANCARMLGDKGRKDLLRRAATEANDLAETAEAPAITGGRRLEQVTLVEAEFRTDGESTRPIYPVISTPDGPRILLELDLSAGSSRTRQFLNRAAIDRLRKAHPGLANEIGSALSDSVRPNESGRD